MTAQKTVYLWTLRNKDAEKSFFGRHLYFARRTSVKNKIFATPYPSSVKLFASKKDAEEYFFKKVRAGIDVSEYKPTRLKFYLDKKGNFDYLRNWQVLRK